MALWYILFNTFFMEGVLTTSSCELTLKYVKQLVEYFHEMMALVTLDLYLNKLDEDFQSPHVREFQKFWLVPQYCPIVLPSC